MKRGYHIDNVPLAGLPSLSLSLSLRDKLVLSYSMKELYSVHKPQNRST